MEALPRDRRIQILPPLVDSQAIKKRTVYIKMKQYIAVNPFRERWILATILHLVPVSGFWVWLMYARPGIYGYVVGGAALCAILYNGRGIWTRWILSYVLLVAGMLIFATWHILEVVFNSTGIFSILIACSFGLLGLAMLMSVSISSIDLACFLGRREFTLRERVVDTVEPRRWPGVCFQVPTYDEPPELVIETLQKLLLQNYPGRWMVQVIDNNTPEPTTWGPVAEFCARHKERISFFHLDNWPGYKSGALNEGTRRLPEWVEHIAIVDADYHVAPEFLRLVVPHLADAEVAYVQTPQSYRGWEESRFLQSLFFNYEEYFQTRNPTRAEVNGIICVGTMAVIRRAALEEVGLWDEVSCTEDAELSLRLLGRGWKGIFDHRAMGFGLMPLDFSGLCKQRFRWAFGMVHIFRKHWRTLFSIRPQTYRLNLVQKLSFWGLGNQFLNELVPISALLALGGAAALSTLWQGTVPASELVLIPFIAFAVYAWGAVLRILLATRNRDLLFPTVGAVIVGFAISWVIARACISAMLTTRVVFLRTPKYLKSEAWWNILKSCKFELLWMSVSAVLCVGMLRDSQPVLAIFAAALCLVFTSPIILAMAYYIYYGRTLQGTNSGCVSNNISVKSL